MDLLLLSLVLWLAQESDASLRIQRAVSPVRPAHAGAAGLVVTEVELETATGRLQTRLLHGDYPFTAGALDALRQWRFSPSIEATHSRTSITFLFRPPLTHPVKIETLGVRPWIPGSDSPSLPQQISDPGYPVASVAAGEEGVVILSASVDASGTVTAVDAVSGNRALVEQSARAIQTWKFSPAMISGKAASSTAIVVIWFVRPS